MDILREALGDSKLNYMGKSYGTFMGALYAKLFPDKIGKVVLDGAVDPTISNYEQTRAQAVAFDGALTSFIKDCIKRTTCPLPQDETKARVAVINLLGTTAKKSLPLKNPNGDMRVVTESLMFIGTVSSLYENGEGWPKLRQAIKEAIAGYGDTYLELADSYTGRREDGSYPNNDFDSGAVIDCLDFAESRSIAQIKADAKKIALAAPVFGPYLGYGGISCKYFPQTNPVVIGQTTTTAPIIIIGTTGDPATPYAWAQGLHKLLTNSQLMTLVGEGHTGHGRGNGCIDDAIDAYYLKGTLPKPDLRCQPENN
jgi:pimeloyl-ACP methyl ester carboxylesterase